MNTYKFKTNINCQACINKVQQPLNDTIGTENWQVDITDRNKTLTVKAKSEQVVIDTLKDVGYVAQPIS